MALVSVVAATHYNIMVNSHHGRIPDEIFESLGFPLDRDEDSTIHRRNEGISQESRQRAKCLTHQHQIKLGEERFKTIRIEQKRREDQTRDKIHRPI